MQARTALLLCSLLMVLGADKVVAQELILCFDAEFSDILRKCGEKSPTPELFPDCVFETAGVMDGSNNINFDATKNFVAGHSNLNAEQTKKALISFDSCVSGASIGGKVLPVVAFGCMNKSLIENGCQQPARV